MVEAVAFGKLILFGEHAVVHGQPALAVPLKALQATVTAEPAPSGSGLQILLPDVATPLRLETHDALSVTAQMVLNHLGVPEPDMVLRLTSTIPLQSGFGSGAAVSTALARALSLALGHRISREDLNAWVYEVEKIHHGTPSGIDNTVIVYERPVFFIRNQTLESFDIAKPFELLVARLGYATPTHITVGDVRTLYEHDPAAIQPIFDQIGIISRQARQAIESGDLTPLGHLMNENHALLRKLTVSDNTLDRLCQVALDAGAEGAKLSGGGRGGNLIVLANKNRAAVQEALLQAGAVEVIHTWVDES
ncbi:MAG: mevalonate kinase [Anaerolineales bacterium]|nr:mevalonate kinase [Anaerolineales bacterium]